MEYQMIIGGEAVKSSNFFDVHDPATGELVGKCPIADKSDLDTAVDAARAAYPSHQLIFISRPTALNSDKGNIVRPERCKYLNYEGEIAIIIGHQS